MIRILTFIISIIIGQQSIVPINSASLEQIQTLPIKEKEAKDLFELVQFQGPLTSIYELGSIEGISPAKIKQLRPLISLERTDKYQSNSRLVDQYRRVENWTSEEGANEGLVEVWLDRLAEPKNINQATWNDLMALQNISPVDAVAVIKRIKESPITYPRALRGAVGLSYWGYRNMVDFFTYDSSTTKRGAHAWYNLTYKTVPSTTSFDEEVGVASYISDHPGDLHHKFVYGYGPNWKISLASHRQLGEKDQATKAAITYRDFKWGSLELERIILGNFSSTIGQGVVFESTDFFSPRRSGYSWSRRVHGVFPDISRTREFALKGIALQGNIKAIQFLGFISQNHRDAVLNPSDSSMAALITLYPRSNVGFNGALTMPMLNTVQERTYGGNLRLTLSPGTYFGVTGYESLYDRPLRPDISTTVIADANEGRFLTSIGNTADTEIAAMYSSFGESPLWSKAQSFRRVFGIDFSTVIKNIALQGEYGTLDKNGDMVLDKHDPKAMFASAFLQFNNLSILSVYRNYDLEFDNPYQRSFANYQRYKGSIFEDTFYLEDPIYGFLYSGQAQPQAERGYYIFTRFQAHRTLVITADFDTWTRLADQSRYYRTVARIQYRPVFNVRFHLRHKWQERGGMNTLDPSSFFSQETILRSQVRLSRYNQMEFIWIRSWVDFTSRRRLTYDLESAGEEPSMVGSAGTGSEGIGFKITHHFNSRLKIQGQTLLYNGFIWNFEDTDFRVFDSSSDAMRYWFSIFSRIDDQWAVRLKFTMDSASPISNFNFEPNDPLNIYPDRRLNWNTISERTSSTDLRLQVDYAI